MTASICPLTGEAEALIAKAQAKARSVSVVASALTQKVGGMFKDESPRCGNLEYILLL